MNRWLFSIRTRLAGFITVLIGVISVFIYLYFPRRLEEQVTRSIIEKAKSIAEMAAFNINSALFFEDYEGIEDGLQGARSNEDVVYIVVLNSNGKEVISYNKEGAERADFLATSNPDHISFEEKLYGYVAPVRLNEQTIGRLFIGLSLEDVRAEVRRSKAAVAMVSLLVFVIGMLCVFGISTLITRPLGRMTQTVRKIAEGDLNQRASSTYIGEVGDLARSFNLMVDELVNAHRELEALNLDLEKRARALQEEITERKRVLKELQESEERVRDILENANDLIQSIRPDGSLLYVNRAWLKILAYRPEEVSGLPMTAIVHPASLATWTESLERLIRGEETGRIGLVLMTNDGRFVDVEGNLSCKFEDGRPAAVRGIFRDVTERKKIDLLKDEFVSTVSHELRTPLTSIHGSLDLVNKMLAGQNLEKVHKLVEIALRNSHRLRYLVDDILDFQKIESGQLVFDIEPVRLSLLVKQALDENRGYGDRYHISFVMGTDLPDVTVNVDQGRLMQVMANLLSNAAKFSPPNGQVEVSIVRNDGKVRVAIRDHGQGIPEEFRGKIFKKFTQVDSSRTREKGGTGLGLSIAKSIIERLGGEIGFESTVNVGSTFYFELPLVPE